MSLAARLLVLWVVATSLHFGIPSASAAEPGRTPAHMTAAPTPAGDPTADAWACYADPDDDDDDSDDDVVASGDLLAPAPPVTPHAPTAHRAAPAFSVALVIARGHARLLERPPAA